MNKLSNYISGNNALTPLDHQEHPLFTVPLGHGFIPRHGKSKEEKLTTILVIISILALLLTF